MRNNPRLSIAVATLRQLLEDKGLDPETLEALMAEAEFAAKAEQEAYEEGEAAAYEEYRAHGLDDEATSDPYTGWSAYDYPPRGARRNDAGEPFID